MGNSPSGFDKNTTAEQVVEGISLEGKNVLITGANTGLGKETCRVLTKAGASVIMGML
jgi:WW domain-containing oxidoreductase